MSFDDTCEVTECRYGDLTAVGKTTITCKKDDKTGKPYLTFDGDFNCEIIWDDGEMIPKSDDPVKLMDFTYYMKIFKITDPDAPVCIPGHEKDSNEILRPEREYSAEGRVVAKYMTRFFSSVINHYPQAGSFKYLDEEGNKKYIGAMSQTVTGWYGHHTEKATLEVYVEQWARLKKIWKACKLGREEKHATLAEYRENNNGDTPAAPCIPLGKMFGANSGVGTDLDNYAVMIGASPDVVTKYHFTEDYICPRTSMEWNDDPLLEMPLHQNAEMNVGTFLFLVFPWIFLCGILPISVIFGTCFFRCCCFYYIRGRNRGKKCLILFDERFGCCQFNPYD